MNVGFYLKNSRIASVDCKTIDNGNPGIGGTFYAMISLIYYLHKNEYSNFNFYTYAESIENLPPTINANMTNSLDALKSMIINDKIDILVINRINELDANEAFFRVLNNLVLKVIIWAHCFIPYKYFKYYESNLMVSRIVCVGKEQLGLMLDHGVYNKSTYIYNGISPEIIEKEGKNSIQFAQRNNEVTYIGSLIPDKGFHLLARAWKKVLKEIPDAKLNVIGSGLLYDKSFHLGRFKIAEKYYEKTFIKHLLNSVGEELLPSVRLLGIIGSDKMDILRKTKVGVPNPSGISETFGYTTIEKQLSGCLIAAKICPGFIDTVNKGSGIFFNSGRALSATIIRLLKKKDYCCYQTIKFIKDSFSFDVITDRWIELFEDIKNEKKCKHNTVEDYRYKYAKIRRLNRFLKKNIPFGYLLPSVCYYEQKVLELRYKYYLVKNIKIYYKKYIEKNFGT